MPKIDAKTLRVAVTIAGYDFTCPQPYASGHCLNEGEAEALNTLFADRVRTNCARTVKDIENNAHDLWGKDPRESAEFRESLQEEIDVYAARYSFASRSDPIRRKALELAKDAIRKQAGDDGFVLTIDSVNSKAEAVIASGRYPAFMETARKFIELQREVAEEELGK